MIRLEAYTERSESNPGHSLGIYKIIKRKLSGRQYQKRKRISMQGTVFQTVIFMYVSYNPETSSQVTLAALGIVFQTKLPTTDNQ